MLGELVDAYDLGRWQYTDDVLISDGRWTFSHPVLTISAGYVNREPDMLLCSYIHEQMHWFSLLERDDPLPRSATGELKEAFPDLPIDPPEWCGSERSNLVHIEVCYREWQVVSGLIGQERFRRAVGERVVPAPYSGMYALVQQGSDTIAGILGHHNRSLPERPPANKRFLHVVSQSNNAEREIRPRPVTDS